MQPRPMAREKSKGVNLANIVRFYPLFVCFVVWFVAVRIIVNRPKGHARRHKTQDRQVSTRDRSLQLHASHGLIRQDV